MIKWVLLSWVNAGIVMMGLLASAGLCAAPADLEGLWASYKRFGPDLQGPVLIDKDLRRAQIGSHVVPLIREEGQVSFVIDGGRGEFVGRYSDEQQDEQHEDQHNGQLKGHWIQPPPQQINQRMASPVVFKHLNERYWVGEVDPRSSEYSFFLPITAQEDGTLATFLRNHDRNLGLFEPIRRIERKGRDLSFMGKYRGDDRERRIARGTYDADGDVLTLGLSHWRGGTYDFHRVVDDEHSYFHPRSLDAGAWQYTPPPELGDGWPTATLEDAQIDLDLISQMINGEIITRDDHISSHRVHGVLIARGGKLVLEEYFHGYDRNTPHDTRSASKSVASMLVGAAMHAGYNIAPATPIYATLRQSEQHQAENSEAELDARKQAMTLEHLLTMASGFYCDDNDPNAPGNEGTLQSQSEQPDWYEYTLDLPMADDPGAQAIYCSANSNLIGAVLEAATQRSLLELFAELIAEPLGVRRYYLGLQPTGEPYFGGGAQWLPRDFMKIGQVMLDGGVWNGQRVVSRDWALESTRPHVKIGERDYGYQWWVNTYPYKDTTVQAFFAAGNGGQIVMGVPELDLVIAFFGGNYSDGVLFRAQNVLIPQYILAAVN